MKRKQSISVIIFYVLMGVLIVGAVGLYVVQLAHNDWVFDPKNTAKFAAVLIGFGVLLTKMIYRTGGRVSVQKYDTIYRQEIGSAFSSPSQKRQKQVLLKAIADYNGNEMESAISQLSSLRNKCDTKQDHGAVLLFLALSYTDLELADDAISTYEELVKILPEHATAWSNLGKLYRRKGKFEKAIDCLERSLQLDDENAVAWNNLAQVHISANNWQKAINPAKRAIALQSNLYQAETALAIAHYALGDYENSKWYYDNAVMHGASGTKLSSILRGMAHGNVMFGESEEVSDEIRRAMGHLQRDTSLPMVELRLLSKTFVRMPLL